MKFLYQDLLNFLSEQPTKEALSEKLFQLGHVRLMVTYLIWKLLQIEVIAYVLVYREI